jgi:uncharacterized protein (DUF58 family)
LTGSLWWWLLAGLFALSAAKRDPSLLLFALLLAAASLASLLWSRYSLAQLRYSRHFGQTRLAFGEETELTLDTYNAKPLPVPWLLLADEYPSGLTLLTGNQGGRVTLNRSLVSLLSLRWYERVQRTYRVRGDRRGAFHFGPATAAAGDIFGLRRQSLTIPGRDVLLVYPKVVPVQSLGLPAARPVGELAAKRRLVDDPLRYQGVRAWAPGDSLRQVHWRATARTGELHSRTYEASASHVLILAVDVQTTSRPYGLVRDYLELLVSAAASLAVAALEQGYAVGLLANAGSDASNELTMVPAGRHPEQGAALLEALARLSDFRQSPLSRVLDNARSRLPYGATVLALTAQPDEALQESLLGLQDGGHPVALLTVGEQPAAVPDLILSYYLGGQDAWQALAQLELA